MRVPKSDMSDLDMSEGCVWPLDAEASVVPFPLCPAGGFSAQEDKNSRQAQIKSADR
jgi:hypothetical protein